MGIKYGAALFGLIGFVLTLYGGLSEDEEPKQERTIENGTRRAESQSKTATTKK